MNKPLNTFSNSSKNWVPHSYQEDAMAFMLQRGAAGLFLDPGLGKTSITLGAFSVLKQQGLLNRMLVIAPLRVCYGVWGQEIAKWQEFNHLRVEILHGKDKDKALRRDADVYVINPEGLKWLFSGKNIRVLDAQMLVVDESTKFKRTTTARFKLLRPMLGRFQRRYILTGTPAPNGLIDLFGQIYILDEGTSLGRFITHFRNEYFYPTGYLGYEWTPKKDTPQRILEKISPITMRLEDKDWLKLPELIENSIVVDLPEQSMRQYKELEEEFITLISGEEVTAVNAGAASIKLRQLANGAAYTADGHAILHDAKLDALEDLVEELSGAPLLVLYQFKHDVARIQERFGMVPYIGSGVSEKKAEEHCMRFNMGDLPILLAHPQSAGHGLNLQERSNHVAFFGPTWDLELHIQAMKRVYRQGNPNTHVHVHTIIGRETIDEVVVRALSGKDKTQRGLLNALKAAYGTGALS